MGDFLKLVAGEVTEANATATSAGASDAGKVIKANGAGVLDPTMLPVGVGSEARSMVAFEVLSAGDVVNYFNDGGTTKMRKADADNGRPADGFVLAAVGAGASGTTYPEQGVITGLAGLSPGATYWLSTAAGALASASPLAPAASQKLGKALSATEFLFKPEAFIAQV